MNMQVISRKQARTQNLKRYFTGNPCPKGHVSERRVSAGGCVECGNAHSLAYQRKKLPTPTRPRPALCELCGQKPPEGKKQLHLDHDHIAGDFRGWLCSVCNMSL